jgi:predicted lipid-binding transport protein (Tim44 family)
METRSRKRAPESSKAQQPKTKKSKKGPEESKKKEDKTASRRSRKKTASPLKVPAPVEPAAAQDPLAGVPSLAEGEPGREPAKPDAIARAEAMSHLEEEHWEEEDEEVCASLATLNVALDPLPGLVRQGRAGTTVLARFAAQSLR